MPNRSQRHLREFQGYDSAEEDEPAPGPPITGGTPTTSSVANVGATGRACGALTAVGGTAPFTFVVTTNPSSLGIDVSGGSLRTTTNPVRAAGLGTFSLGLRVTDVNGQVFNYTDAVTLT